jgi:ABC-type polysaccharide transport system, permease component
MADIIDTCVYRMGIINNDYSFSTAAGMFKSVEAWDTYMAEHGE